MNEILSSSFRSLATGETPAFIQNAPGQLADVAGESFYSGTVNGALRYYSHSNHYTETVGVERIIVQLGTSIDEWETDILDEQGDGT